MRMGLGKVPYSRRAVSSPRTVPGTPGCEMAVHAFIADGLPLCVEKHIGARRERRFLAKVDESVSAVGQVDRHETAAAEIAAAGVRDGERVTHGYRRVHGISALTQNRGAHIGGQVLCGHDHAVRRFQCRRSSGMRGCAREYRRGHGD